MCIIKTCCFFFPTESTTELIEGTYGSVTAQLIYGVFTTPPNSISGSAVCAFALQDITDTFEGNFKEQAQLNSNWLPVQSAKVVAEILFLMQLQYSILFQKT
jgi:semaphorin 6